MLVSVVIPLYDKADVVEAAIASVRAQTLASGLAGWELVVVDDGSRDDGAHRVRRVSDPRIRVVSQPNGGVARARNTGLQAARHDWVAFLDADDTWDATHLADLAALHARFPAARLLASTFRYVDEQGQVRRTSAKPHHLACADGLVLLQDYGEEVHRHGMPFVTSSVMVHRRTALDIGGFRPGVVAGEDLLLWAQLSARAPVALAANCTTTYTEPPMQAATRRDVIRRPQQPDAVGAALCELAEATGAPAGLRRFAADWHRMRAVLWMELNERAACLAELRRAWRLDRVLARDAACVGALAMPDRLRAALLARRRGRT